MLTQAMAQPDVETSVEVTERLAPLCRVVCHDDPVTTMDFVVHVFMEHFRMTYDRAIERMMDVHKSGASVIAHYPKSMAEKRVQRAKGYARANGFPLTFSIEDEA
ncbi:MAG: ATP-dependent Clp protease adaptor ClpS [Planctomycetes bacterium]|nr:ATP-dependent Clp protease adaptor ClpS [Planctomycetota bacterium]MCB9908860.1 ATP-dependent Clp protease adaptor ClpS [Planctomycetota bacterium]HRV83145.1 ATP-dependent Clp protease adaptor ClpS [Planctomycetota bacterium]